MYLGPTLMNELHTLVLNHLELGHVSRGLLVALREEIGCDMQGAEQSMLSQIFDYVRHGIVHVSVSLSGVQLCTVSASSSSTVREIRQAVEAQTGICFDGQRLVHGARVLSDVDTVGTHHITPLNPGLRLVNLNSWQRCVVGESDEALDTKLDVEASAPANPGPICLNHPYGDTECYTPPQKTTQVPCSSEIALTTSEFKILDHLSFPEQVNAVTADLQQQQQQIDPLIMEERLRLAKALARLHPKVPEMIELNAATAEEEDFPSIGTMRHGTFCLPCKFLKTRNGCMNGKSCKMCHSPEHDHLTYSVRNRIARKYGKLMS